MQNTLEINEVFESIQGEGGRAGTWNIFIRLSGCNLSCAFCDTEHTKKRTVSICELIEEIKKFSGNSIIWTGGEPLLQLDTGIISTFKKLGYFQAIETNGTIDIPPGLDYVAISPKSKAGFRQVQRANEIRILDSVALEYVAELEACEPGKVFISPIFINGKFDLSGSMNLVKSNYNFRLSVQLHKLLGVK